MVLTRQQKQKALDNVLTKVMLLDIDDVLVKALQKDGINSVQDLLSMSSLDIDDMTYMADDG